MKLSFKSLIVVTSLAFLLFYIFLAFQIFNSYENLAVSEANKRLESFLHMHKAIRSYIEDVQKTEIYRLKTEGLLYEDYFSQKTLSSTFITRSINDILNEEYHSSNKTSLYFKYAADNPRNPANQADSYELKLLNDFRNHDVSEFKSVVDFDDVKFLYYAIPVDSNKESCLNCHGLPEDAPQELIENYGEMAGFFEKTGQLRALMSVRVPLHEYLENSKRTALTISAVAFVLLAGVFSLVFFFFRSIEKQQKAQARIQRAEKMESIGLLAGGVAHDLNNILSGIINYPELILRRIPPDSEIVPYVQAITNSGRRAAAVVSDLLTVARDVASKKVLKDLNAIITDLLATPDIQAIMHRHPDVSFTQDLHEGDLNINCSPVHIEKSLTNILLNAFEAVDAQGNCQIRSIRSYIDQTLAKKFNVAAGEYCCVEIRDNGHGIPANDLAHIFEPFYSTKKLGRSGSGLGLAVVWNTVKEHGGIIETTSDSTGTCFKLCFPAATESLIETCKNEIHIDQLSGHHQRILVVDDEPSLRDIATRILTDLNYSITPASSGEEAIKLLEENSYDLVLLDMIMEPGIGGRETYEAMFKLRPRQKVLITSGFSSSSDVKETLQMGAKDFLQKPYTSVELGLSVKKILSN